MVSEDDAGVVAAETKGIAQHPPYRQAAAFQQHVHREIRIDCRRVEAGWKQSFSEAQACNDGLGDARRTQGVTSPPLGRTARSIAAEQARDSEVFCAVVSAGRGAVQVDIVDLCRLEPAALKRARHGKSGTGTFWMG